MRADKIPPGEPTSLREQKKRQARKRILRAAETLVRSVGFAQTKMRNVAIAAGVSYQTLYNYFPTKASVVEAMLTEDAHALSTDTDQIIRAYNQDLLAVLQKINRHRIRFVEQQDRNLWREVCIGLIQQDEGANKLLRLFDTDAHERLVQLLRAGQGSGELSIEADIELMAHSIYCLSEYAFMEYLINEALPTETLGAQLDAQIQQLVLPYLR